MIGEKPGSFWYGSLQPRVQQPASAPYCIFFSVISQRVLFVELFVEPVCRELEEQDEDYKHRDIDKRVEVRGAGPRGGRSDVQRVRGNAGPG